MKDTKQIIEDCGIANTRAGSFLALIVSRKFTPFHADGAIEETMGQIIGALYRRIETLENGPDEAEEGADVCSVCDTVFAPKTLLAINEAEFELICPECMLARIKKLEEEKARSTVLLERAHHCLNGIANGRGDCLEIAYKVAEDIAGSIEVEEGA